MYKCMVFTYPLLDLQGRGVLQASGKDQHIWIYLFIQNLNLKHILYKLAPTPYTLHFIRPMCCYLQMCIWKLNRTQPHITEKVSAQII